MRRLLFYVKWKWLDFKCWLNNQRYWLREHFWKFAIV